MIYSMTGYGSAAQESGSTSINVEVKTLNSKFLDTNLRSPKLLAEKEIEIRNLVSEYMKRGKVSISIEIDRTAVEETSFTLNETLFKKYYGMLSSLADDVKADQSDIFKTVISYPDVTVSNQDALTEEIWQDIKTCIINALKNCNTFREQEGKVLDGKLRSYISGIKNNFQGVIKLDPKRIEHIKERIRSNIEEVFPPEKIDQNRFEQEIIYYIEKIDITEEKVRLGNHLDYFLKTMDDKEPGKKLGFISQEIGREINTIGSKANDAEIQQFVVAMKDDLEKVKEQALNIL